MTKNNIHLNKIYTLASLDSLASLVVVFRIEPSTFTTRALIGELDEGKDALQDLSAIRAAPLKPVIH